MQEVSQRLQGAYNRSDLSMRNFCSIDRIGVSTRCFKECHAILMSAIPIFDKPKINLFRSELNGYFSFNLKMGGIAVPWLINRTGWEVLLLCDGCHTIFEIIKKIHDRYKNIAIETINDDVIKVVSDLTRMQILCWRWKTESFGKSVLVHSDLCIKEISKDIEPIVDAYLQHIMEKSRKESILLYVANPQFNNANNVWGDYKSLGNPIELSYVELNQDCIIENSISIIVRSIDGLKLSTGIVMINRFCCATEGAYDRWPVVLRKCTEELFKYDSSFNKITVRLLVANIEKDSNQRLFKLLDRSGFRLSYRLRVEHDYQDVECLDFQLNR